MYASSVVALAQRASLKADFKKFQVEFMHIRAARVLDCACHFSQEQIMKIAHIITDRVRELHEKVKFVFVAFFVLLNRSSKTFSKGEFASHQWRRRQFRRDYLPNESACRGIWKEFSS